MSTLEINTHELSGDGMIIIDGENVETVFYSLTIAPEPGPVVAEGSISGSEALLRKSKKAGEVSWRWRMDPSSRSALRAATTAPDG